MSEFQDKNKDLALKLEALLAAEPPPPADLKDEVFTTLDTLGLLGDFADLFGAKFGSSHVSMINPDDSDES